MRRLSVRFLVSYLLVVGAVAGVSSVYLHYRLKAYFLQIATEDLYRTASMVSAVLEEVPVPAGSMDELCRRMKRVSGSRVTLIRRDGSVAGDSDVPSSSMENHLYRAEIQKALQDGQGSSIRKSTTLGFPMLYCAVCLEGAGHPYIVRLSVPMSRIASHLGTIGSRLLEGAAVGLFIVFPLLYVDSRSLSRRIGRLRGFLKDAFYGPTSRRLYVGPKDELGQFEQELDEVSEGVRRQTEALAALRTQFEALIEALDEGVIVLDPDDKVLFANPQAARLLGVDLRALTGMRLTDAVRTHAFYELLRSKCEGGPVCGPMEFSVPGSPEKVYQASLTSIHAAERGPTAGCIVRLRDISEEKRLESIRSGFVSHVSHQLRTPLTLIKGYVETLQTEGFGDTERAARYLSVIEESTDALVRMVNGLLRLSAIELGRLPVRKEPVNLRELVDKLCRTFSDRARKKGLFLENAVPVTLPEAYADPERLYEVMLALYDNAVKYTVEGGITVSAAYLPAREAGARALIDLSVTDTGIGIPAGEIQRVTERFYRCERHAGEGVGEGDGGSGLGLAIAKHLVRLMGGRLSIASKEHRGTTVTITLPACAPSPPQAALP